MADGNPNYYTRKNVLELARVIDPVAWFCIPKDCEPKLTQYRETKDSIDIAAKVLIAGYRDCTVK